MATYLEALPPPRSGLPLEVSFRRLLKSCEDIVAGDDKGRPDLQNYSTSPVFHANVDFLQEQLADLSSMPKSNISYELLDIYRRRVEMLSHQLKPIVLPAYCRPQKLEQAQREDSQPAQQQKAVRTEPAVGSQAAKTVVPPLQTDAQARLDRQTVLQESLTEDMVALAAGLKKNAQAMQQAVARREGLLDETENAVEDSLVKAKKSSKESQSLRVKGSLTFCMIMLSIIVVSMVFLGTYIFIKATSLVGYKSSPR